MDFNQKGEVRSKWLPFKCLYSGSGMKAQNMYSAIKPCHRRVGNYLTPSHVLLPERVIFRFPCMGALFQAVINNNRLINLSSAVTKISSIVTWDANKRSRCH